MQITGRKRDIIGRAIERDMPTTSAGLARACGVSRLTMYRVLRGDAVSAHTAESIARSLGVPVGVVFDIRVDGEG